MRPWARGQRGCCSARLHAGEWVLRCSFAFAHPPIRSISKSLKPRYAPPLQRARPERRAPDSRASGRDLRDAGRRRPLSARPILSGASQSVRRAQHASCLGLCSRCRLALSHARQGGEGCASRRAGGRACRPARGAVRLTDARLAGAKIAIGDSSARWTGARGLLSEWARRFASEVLGCQRTPHRHEPLAGRPIASQIAAASTGSFLLHLT